MNIPEQCKPLKKSYDDCFNLNMSNLYSELFGGNKKKQQQQQTGQSSESNVLINVNPNHCEQVFEVRMPLLR